MIDNPTTWTKPTTGLCPACLRTVPAVLTEVDGMIGVAACFYGLRGL
jgi:uncharacterized radical SAM superfamily Fe-S cluster-containing enzyme